MKYVLNSVEMQKETLYNNIRQSDYTPCPDYLSGLKITSRDYREVFEEYKNVPAWYSWSTLPIYPPR